MDLRKTILAVSVLVSLSTRVESQRLRIGDRLPDLAIGNVMFSEDTVLDLADYRGKYLLIELWRTSCKICLKSFKKLDSLQRSFPDFLQIVAVNTQEKDSVIRFLQRPNIKVPSVPFVLEDRVLDSLMPSHFVPWVVWIDKDGIVRHITGSEGLNHEDVTNFLAGRPLHTEDVQYSGIDLIRKRE